MFEVITDDELPWPPEAMECQLALADGNWETLWAYGGQLLSPGLDHIDPELRMTVARCLGVYLRLSHGGRGFILGKIGGDWTQLETEPATKPSLRDILPTPPAP